jgi:trigger factor
VKITQEEVVDRQTVLNIELEEDDIAPYLDQGYRRVVNRTVIPGFRKGKAPRRLIEHHYGRTYILEPVLEQMVSEVTETAIGAQEIEASGHPEIELTNIDPITVKATVPLKPEIILGDYKSIKIAEEEVEITEEDIQERLDDMREDVATWEPAERAVEMGDLATIQVKMEIEGESILDTETEFVLTEDNPRPVTGFTEQLVGMEIDAEKNFSITVPEDFEEERFQGKEAIFTVTVTDLKAKVLPPLDDAFAQTANEEYETLDAFKEHIRTEAVEEAEAVAKNTHREKVLEALIEGATINMPPVLLEHEAGHVVQERLEVLSRLNIRAADYLTMMGKSEEDLRSEAKEEAESRLVRTFVLTELAEKEGIEISDEELDTRIEEIQSRNPNQNSGEVSDEAKDSLRRIMLVEAAIERLSAMAKDGAPAAVATDTEITEEIEEKPDENGEAAES